jgi:hypothetical protein
LKTCRSMPLFPVAGCLPGLAGSQRQINNCHASRGRRPATARQSLISIARDEI